MKPADMIQTQRQLEALRILPSDGSQVAISQRKARWGGHVTPAEPRINEFYTELETLCYRGLVAIGSSKYWLTEDGKKAQKKLKNVDELEVLSMEDIHAMLAHNEVHGFDFDETSDEYYPDSVSHYNVEHAGQLGRSTMIEWMKEALARVV